MENSTTTHVFALTTAITLQTAANTTNFAKMINMFQTQSANMLAHLHIPSKSGILKFYC